MQTARRVALLTCAPAEPEGFPLGPAEVTYKQYLRR